MPNKPYVCVDVSCQGKLETLGNSNRFLVGCLRGRIEYGMDAIAVCILFEVLNFMPACHNLLSKVLSI
jgi:hypothetical protein